MGKKYIDSAKLIDKSKAYDPSEALELVCQTSKAKFDETIEIHIRLGVDSRHADQQVRGAVVLPNGTGKNVKVLVFAKGDNVAKAEAAGADYVGGAEYAEKIVQENWFDFDVVIASPDMMGVIGKLGKVLGPKGLMPSPKAGTVTPDVARAVTEAKAGKIEYTGQDQHHPLPHRKGFLRNRETDRELQHAGWRRYQGKARCCKGSVYQELRNRKHHGPRNQDQPGKAWLILGANNKKNRDRFGLCSFLIRRLKKEKACDIMKKTVAWRNEDGVDARLFHTVQGSLDLRDGHAA